MPPAAHNRVCGALGNKVSDLGNQGQGRARAAVPATFRSLGNYDIRTAGDCPLGIAARLQLAEQDNSGRLDASGKGFGIIE